MERVFDSLGQSIYNINGHKGYIIEWRIISPFCKKWSRNRDPDLERVNEMIIYYNSGGYIPRMIHLSEIKDEGIVCYDGNHRKEVFDKCNDEKILCVVDVMFNATQNDVYKAFISINKSVQLPEIYIEDTSNLKLDILQLVKEYEIKYKFLLSSSSRCHAPHFNRDTFTDNIYTIYKSFNNTITIEKIGELLDKLNNEYSQNRLCRPHSFYKQSIIDKCRKYNMWLFIEKQIPFEHIEKML